MKRLWMLLLMISLTTTLFLGNGVAVSAASVSETLSGKSALFTGDSITYGYGEQIKGQTPRSWPLRIRDKYHMTVTNNGLNGHSLTDVRLYPGLDKRLHTYCFPAQQFDYVILQGGINDIIGAEANKGVSPVGQAVPIGTMAATKNLADFDTSTFAGGLERYFYHATTKYPHARIGFIITYQTPKSTWGGNTKNAAAYWDMARQICAKWDVPYLDLFDKKYSIDVLKANTNVYLIDTLHLGASGYDVITDPIAAWMATLQKYGEVDVKVPTTTKKPTTTTTTKKPTTTTTKKLTTTTTTMAVEKNTTTADNKTTTTVSSAADPTASHSATTTVAKPSSAQTTKIEPQRTESAEDAEHTAAPTEKKDKENAASPHYTWIVIVAAAAVAVVATILVLVIRARA